MEMSNDVTTARLYILQKGGGTVKLLYNLRSKSNDVTIVRNILQYKLKDRCSNPYRDRLKPYGISTAKRSAAGVCVSRVDGDVVLWHA